VHTPRFCGHESKALDLLAALMMRLPLRTSCWIVGIVLSQFFWKGKITETGLDKQIGADF
jgi:hypothetical protein